MPPQRIFFYRDGVANNMFNNQLWDKAEQCYLKAGAEVRAFEAGAKSLSAAANALRGSAPEARADVYNKSATAWMRL